MRLKTQEINGELLSNPSEGDTSGCGGRGSGWGGRKNDGTAEMRGKEPGRVAIACGSSPEGALFFRFPLFLADLLPRKKGDCRGRSAKKGGGFMLENYSNFCFRATPLDTDRHNDDDDDGGHKPKNGPNF